MCTMFMAQFEVRCTGKESADIFSPCWFCLVELCDAFVSSSFSRVPSSRAENLKFTRSC